MRYITAGTQNVSLETFLGNPDSTNGAGVTGILYNTSGLLARYYRADTGPVNITLATQTPTGVFSAGGFVEVSPTGLPGVYRLDLPNAAVAVGAESAVVYVYGPSNVVASPIGLQFRNVPTETQSISSGSLASITSGIFNGLIDNTLTFKQFMRACGALAAGQTSGGGTASVIFKALNDGATTRITATVDSSGNRSSVTLNL